MRRILGVALFILNVILCAIVAAGNIALADERVDIGIQGTDSTALVPTASKEIVKISERGIEPETYRSSKLDSSVFFLNATDKVFFDLEVDYEGKKMHCHSQNFEWRDGKMSTSSPLKPQDFAIACFPERGTYSVTVRKAGTTEEGKRGKIIIE